MALRAANILCYKLIYSIHSRHMQTNRFRQHLQCLWIIVLSRFTMNHPPQYGKRTFEPDQFQHLATGAHSSAVLSRPRSRLRWGYRPKRRNTAPCASWDRIASTTSVWHSFCFSLIALKSPRSPWIGHKKQNTINQLSPTLMIRYKLDTTTVIWVIQILLHGIGHLRQKNLSPNSRELHV